MEDELDSFLGERMRAGEPPQPLSEHGDSSSARGSRQELRSEETVSKGGAPWERVGLGSLVIMSFGMVPGKLGVPVRQGVSFWSSVSTSQQLVKSPAALGGHDTVLWSVFVISASVGSFVVDSPLSKG